MPTHRQGNMNPGPIAPIPDEPKKKTGRRRLPARPNTKVTVEQTEELFVDDPPNVFMTPHGHLGGDIIHHPDPRGKDGIAPIYDQTAKAMGWDPIAGDLPPHIQEKVRASKDHDNKLARDRRAKKKTGSS